jgi:hypothetical protein
MDKTAIYNALDPAWWVQQTNGWNTTFVSTQIIYSTAALTGCTYISSCPIQTSGLNSGSVDAPASELATTVDILRLEAAQRLYDMHTTDITGHQNLGSVYGATA